jgi:hypothetical protein
MEDHFIYWSICLGSLALGKIVSSCLCENPSKFLEAYGGCECGKDDCKKIDRVYYRGKTYSRINNQDSKMTYKYCKIYNVSKSEWAHNVSGDDDAKKIWEDNEWEENDALVGFFSEFNGDFHNVIFCRPGYAVFVQAEDEKTNFEYEDETHRVPPAILVNLNDAYDTEFLHSKVHPEEMEMDDDDSDSESEYEEDDDDDMTEDEDDNDDDDDDEPLNKPSIHIPENQRVIDFLYKCRAATDNKFKKDAYDVAIKEFHSYWSMIYPPTWKPCTIGPSIERKIREFLDGIPEEDIINS